MDAGLDAAKDLFDKDKYKNFMGKINQDIGKNVKHWTFWIYREGESY